MSEFCVFSSESFAIFNEACYYSGTYSDLGLRMDERLFAINGPFMMESQFDAMKRPDRRVRKRKSHFRKNQDRSDEISKIEKLSSSIRDEGLRIAIFRAQSIKDNNRQAREKAREILDRSIKMYHPAAIVSTEIISLSDNSSFVVKDEFCLLNSWYKNDSDHCIRLRVSAEVLEQTIVGDVFDLVVLDPPWENRSVKRQRSYVTCESPLESVDLECLTADGLVAIWITNRKGIESEVEAFFQRWKLTRLATFFWLKVRFFDHA
ncbi:MT-A70 domain containing protein [Trichostrongylus colubriformis]|uniref:MT-A70 domain containing protein n=1 Tax=Trichostrongylus colubriformis TaxID=6319 RepID=A0AAN8IDG5_TRICO